VTEPFVTEATFPEKIKEWKKKVEPYNFHFMKPDPEKTALLVIDMQRCFLEPGASAFTQGAPPILPNVRRLIETFRESDLPVIFSTHVHKDLKYDGGMMAQWWGSNIMEGTAEAEIHPAISPTPEDKVIVKHRYSAFYNTDLELTLRCLGTKDLVIAGVMTNLCCESTARDAFFRDFRVFFLLDATGAVTEEFHLSTLINLAYGFAYVTDTDEMLSHFR
jgi:nicotinamidase-related amidase